MYAEIQRAASCSARQCWPGLKPAADPSGDRWIASLKADLAQAGWIGRGESLCANPQGASPGIAIYLALPSRLRQPAAVAHLTAQTAALALLVRMHLPLRQKLTVSFGDPSTAARNPLVLLSRPQPAAAGGELVLPRPERGGGFAAPVLKQLHQAQNALRNAGLQPGLRLGTVGAGLGYQAPGEPARSPQEMADAVNAYAALLYGLAGYGVMAFQFDLDF